MDAELDPCQIPFILCSKGQTGKRGPRGFRGLPGPQGPQGRTGDPGPDGEFQQCTIEGDPEEFDCENLQCFVRDPTDRSLWACSGNDLIQVWRPSDPPEPIEPEEEFVDANFFRESGGVLEEPYVGLIPFTPAYMLTRFSLVGSWNNFRGTVIVTVHDGGFISGAYLDLFIEGVWVAEAFLGDSLGPGTYLLIFTGDTFDPPLSGTVEAATDFGFTGQVSINYLSLTFFDPAL